jgi:ABC-2 type transport system ATP-binding protein
MALDMSERAAPVVEAVGVHKRWGTTTALDSVTLTIGSGVTGLLGANGAGKTTFIGLVLGLHKATEGTLSVLGLDPTRAGPAVRARLGYSPEHHLLPPDVQAYDFVRHVSELHGLPHRDAMARASDALFQVGLGEERFRPLGTMSTGQRQRVKLAQAIAHDPRLVLLDEPTDGLDPVQRDEMLALIRRIGTEFGIDIVLSSHLLEEIEQVCDNAVLLDGGRLAASGALAELTGRDLGLVIEVDDGMDDLQVALERAGAAVTVDGHRLVVTASLSEDVLYDLVRDEVATRGLSLHRLQRRQSSLEDLFLEFTSPDMVATAPEQP